MSKQNKVRMRVALSKLVYQPGEEIIGNVHLEIFNVTSLSAFRLHINGTEHVEALIPNGISTLFITETNEYVNHYLTFIGESVNKRFGGRNTDFITSDSSVCTNAKTVHQYEIGCYHFPFRVTLPLNAAPSYAIRTECGQSCLEYTAKLVVEVVEHKSSHKSDSMHSHLIESDCVIFRVAATTTQSQITVRASRPMPHQVELLMYRHAFMCCLFGVDVNEKIELFVRLIPGLLSLQTGTTVNTAQNVNESGVAANTTTISNNNGNSNESSNNEINSVDHINNNANINTTASTTRNSSSSDNFTFRGTVRVKNMCTTETLKRVIVNLINFVVVRYGQHEMLHKLVVGKTCIPASVSPKTSAELPFTLPINFTEFRTEFRSGYKLPLPSFQTSVIRSIYALELEFPKNKLSSITCCYGIVDIVEQTSQRRDLYRAPATFTQLRNIPTETFYVTAPTHIRFPSEDKHIFPTHHEPYLPRERSDLYWANDEHLSTVSTSVMDDEHIVIDETSVFETTNTNESIRALDQSEYREEELNQYEQFSTLNNNEQVENGNNAAHKSKDSVELVVMPLISQENSMHDISRLSSNHNKTNLQRIHRTNQVDRQLANCTLVQRSENDITRTVEAIVVPGNVIEARLESVTSQIWCSSD